MKPFTIYAVRDDESAELHDIILSNDERITELREVCDRFLTDDKIGQGNMKYDFIKRMFGAPEIGPGEYIQIRVELATGGSYGRFQIMKYKYGYLVIGRNVGDIQTNTACKEIENVIPQLKKLSEGQFLSFWANYERP
jgi:hypothetical protein